MAGQQRELLHGEVLVQGASEPHAARTHGIRGAVTGLVHDEPVLPGSPCRLHLEELVEPLACVMKPPSPRGPGFAAGGVPMGCGGINLRAKVGDLAVEVVEEVAADRPWRGLAPRLI